MIKKSTTITDHKLICYCQLFYYIFPPPKLEILAKIWETKNWKQFVEIVLFVEKQTWTPFRYNLSVKVSVDSFCLLAVMQTTKLKFRSLKNILALVWGWIRPTTEKIGGLPEIQSVCHSTYHSLSKQAVLQGFYNRRHLLIIMFLFYCRSGW